ncbi:MAG: HIT domain-containing protein [Phycisphaerales bacterium]
MPDAAPTNPSPQNLHAPWRMSYMQMLSAADRAAKEPDAAPTSPRPAANASPKPASFFREYFLDPASDQRHHVIVRTGVAGLSAEAVQESGSGVRQVAPNTPNPAPHHPNPDDDLAGLILLNKYPYANGHLLIALGEARPRLLDYTPRQRAELWRLTDLAVGLCEKTLFPQGVNVGLNQATAAGAGVPEHVHVHVVPRWVGDVNFISVVGQVRVIPGALDDMYRRYREVWESFDRAA